MFKNRLILLAIISFTLIAGLACMCSLPNALTSALEGVMEEQVVEVEDTIVIPVEDPEPEETEEVIVVEEPEVEEPEVEETEPADEGEFQELLIPGDVIWAQEDTSVLVAFLFENRNSNVLFEEVDYTINLYDASGGLLQDWYSVLPTIYPNEQFGVAEFIYLAEEEDVVASVVVEWEYKYSDIAPGTVNPLTVQKIAFWPNEGYPIVTGWIGNSSADTYTSLRAYVLCFDGAGEIIGGNSTYLSFMPDNYGIGFSTYVTVYGDVERVEVYPIMTLGAFGRQENVDWGAVSIQELHFFEDQFGYLVGGVVIKNETGSVIKNSNIALTFYDTENFVTSIGSSYVDYLLPGEILGISPFVYSSPAGSETVGWEGLVLPGTPDETYELSVNPFVIESVDFSPDSDYYVDVVFTNTYSKQVSEVDVHVLVYNTFGEIIGGGKSWTSEATPAGGTGEVQVYVGYPSNIEVSYLQAWVVPSYWTDFD